MLAGEERILETKNFVHKAVPMRTFQNMPMGIALNPDVIKTHTRQQVESLVAHELTHYMTYGCINSAVSGIDELLVRTIEAAHFDPFSSTQQKRLLNATSGFRCRDYFSLLHSRISRDAMYETVEILAPSIQEEQAWKIYERLLSIRQKMFVPRYEEIAKVISDVGGNAGRKILRSPLAMMARAGTQHLALKRTAGDCDEVDVYTFTLNKNPDAGNVNNKKWSGREFLSVDETNAKYSLCAFDAENKIVGKSPKRETLANMVTLRLHDIMGGAMESLHNRPQSISFRIYHGNTIRFDLPLSLERKSK
jgi:hypothetical protein